MLFRIRTFALRSIFIAMLGVALIMWWLTPKLEDRRAEKRLVGTWEVRLEEIRTPSTETRVVEFPLAEQYGLSNGYDNSQFWRIRDEILCNRVRVAWAPGEISDLKLEIQWKTDDEFVAKVVGTPNTLYYRRIPYKDFLRLVRSQ